MQALAVVPLDFQSREAVADGVSHVREHVLNAGQHVHKFPDLGGHVPCLGVFRGGDHIPFQGQQRPLPFAHLRRKVIAAIFHVGKERMLFRDIARVGVGQDAAQAVGRKTVGQIRHLFQIEQRGVQVAVLALLLALDDFRTRTGVPVVAGTAYHHGQFHLWPPEGPLKSSSSVPRTPPNMPGARGTRMNASWRLTKP